MRIALVVLAAGIVITSCSPGDDSGDANAATTGPPVVATGTASATAPAPPASTQIDVTFAEGLLVYRRQATALADVTASRAADKEVSQLAQGLPGIFKLEEQQLLLLLDDWGRRPPPDSAAGTANPDLPGTFSAETTAELARLSGAALDQRFVSLLIDNLQGAMKLATTEEQAGASGPARQLATRVSSAGTALLANLRNLENRLK